MKLVVFVYAPKPPQPVEQVLRLDLRAAYGGGVEVVAVDEEGKVVMNGHILQFRPDGTIHLCRSVSPDIGLQITPGAGTVKLD